MSFNQAVEAIARGVDVAGMIVIAGGIGLTSVLAVGRLWRRQSQVYHRFAAGGTIVVDP